MELLRYATQHDETRWRARRAAMAPAIEAAPPPPPPPIPAAPGMVSDDEHLMLIDVSDLGFLI